MVAIDLGGMRLDNTLGDLPNHAAKRGVMRCKFEIQLRRYLE